MNRIPDDELNKLVAFAKSAAFKWDSGPAGQLSAETLAVVTALREAYTEIDRMEAVAEWFGRVEP